MQVENAINSWRKWDASLSTRPAILSQLSGGRSNRSFLLDSNGRKMVLRLNGTDTMIPGTNRSNEISVWQAASKKGIAPPLLHFDEQNRFLVSTYISNSLSTNPPHNNAFINQAFELLKSCHQLDVNAPIINYINHIEQYWQIAELQNKPVNPALQQQRKPMQKLVKEITNSNPQTGLCHHDPVIANFVGTQKKLYLIDWEYAAHGLLTMDYAALGTEWGLDNEVILERTSINPELLTMAKTLYKYLCNLWQEITT